MRSCYYIHGPSKWALPLSSYTSGVKLGSVKTIPLTSPEKQVDSLLLPQNLSLVTETAIGTRHDLSGHWHHPYRCHHHHLLQLPVAAVDGGVVAEAVVGVAAAGVGRTGASTAPGPVADPD